MGSNRLLVTRRHFIYFNIGAFFYIETLLLFQYLDFFFLSLKQCRFISLAMSVFLRLLYCFLLRSTANSLSLVGFTMTLFERNVQLHSVFI